MKEVRVGDAVERVVEGADYPPSRQRAILKDETIAVLGYGTLGRAHALNLRDAGLNVIVGQRGGASHQLAVEDGWVAGTNLFEPVDAAIRGTVVQYLLSDAGQKELWPKIARTLTTGKALYLAHGFSIVYGDQTGVQPPKDIDVILMAPKGAGTTLRRQYRDRQTITASFAAVQDATGRARERCLALGAAFGSTNLLETTVENEVYADLTGERGVLLGAIYGLWLAQYEVLRAHGHSAVESFFESVEEATQSLYPLIAEKGMDWMYANCSTTAQRGALDWFRQFRDAVKPVFMRLYDSVSSGTEARRVLEANGRSDYKETLAAELAAIAASEMWQAGAAVRGLRSPNGPEKEALGK